MSVYSDISRGRCDKRQAQRGEDGLVAYRCRLGGDLALELVYAGASVQATFPCKGEKTGAQSGAGYDVGDALEWRGRRTNGAFAPGAAILQLVSRVDADRFASVFAILRVDGERFCPAGWIDAGATPKANARARALADTVMAQFKCGVDEARIDGAQTELLRETIARSR